MFVIRGLNGQTLFETGEKNSGDESIFATYAEAKTVLDNLEQSLPPGMFKVVALRCERCNGENDVAIIHVNDEPKAFCIDCRVQVFAKKNPVGRPAMGVTKKVSVTLNENDWEWLDEKAEGNRSAFIRDVIWKALGSEAEWSNHACLGYAIKGLENLNYSPEEIKKIVRSISLTFDMTSVPEAKKIYETSPY